MPHARSRLAVPRDGAVDTTFKGPTRALSLKQVVELTNLSKGHIYALITRGEFPAPGKIGRKSIWNQREVEFWLEARFAERGQP